MEHPLDGWRRLSAYVVMRKGQADRLTVESCPPVPSLLTSNNAGCTFNETAKENLRPSMGTPWSITIIGLGLLLAAMPASAHHSFAAEFDAQQPVTLTGSLTKMEWVNPHGWIYVDVKGADGTVVNWAIEVVAPNALLRRGLRKEDFPIGSQLVVKGYRAKSGKPIANG